jgi:RNA polymerase sigma factor FliA
MTAAELAYSTNDDDVERRNELVVSELPQVYYSAKRIRERLPQHVELEDLVQAGVLGLIDAAAKYDDTKNVKFSTFAKFRINGAILDSLRKMDWGSRTLRRKSRAINQSSSKIGSERGRQATHEEIAADLGMSDDELHDTMTQLNSLYVIGQVSESSSEPGMTHDLIESAPSKGDDDPFDLCLKSENRALLVAALEVLTERERMVIQLYYQEELTMREIAEILGFVVTRISQIHAGAILKMREAMKEPQPSKPKPRTMSAAARPPVRTASVMRHA